MRWILTLTTACLLALSLASAPAWSASRNFLGDTATLANDEDETAAITCVHDLLRVVGTGTLSSGDSIFLEIEDAAGAYQALHTYDSTDMPLDKLHACSGRRGAQYKVTLDDADNSSDVDVEVWVVPRGG